MMSLIIITIFWKRILSTLIDHIYYPTYTTGLYNTACLTKISYKGIFLFFLHFFVHHFSLSPSKIARKRKMTSHAQQQQQDKKYESICFDTMMMRPFLRKMMMISFLVGGISVCGTRTKNIYDDDEPRSEQSCWWRPTVVVCVYIWYDHVPHHVCVYLRIHVYSTIPFSPLIIIITRS